MTAMEWRRLNTQFASLQAEWSSFTKLCGLVAEAEIAQTQLDFHLFDRRGFVRFDFGLDDGFITYGLYQPTEYAGQCKQVRMFVFAFDPSGNLYEVNADGSRGSPLTWRIITTHSVQGFHNEVLSRICKSGAFSAPKVSLST